MKSRLLLACILAGCAGGTIATPPAAPGNAMHRQAPLASSCFRRNASIPRIALRGGKQVLIRTSNPNNVYANFIVRNLLRTHDVKAWPVNNPSAVVTVKARSNSGVVTVSPPSRAIVVQRATFGKDRGPSVQVNGRVCPIS